MATIRMYVFILTLFTPISFIAAQGQIKVNAGSMNDEIISAHGKMVESTTFEFSSGTRNKMRLNIEMIDFHKNKTESVKTLIMEDLGGGKNEKLYVGIDIGKQGMLLKSIMIGKYMNIIPLTHSAETEFQFFVFNTRHSLQANKTVPMYLIVEEPPKIHERTIGGILESQTIDSLDKEAAGDLPSTFKVITYQLLP